MPESSKNGADIPIKLENLEVPEIRKEKNEEDNPLEMKFGINDIKQENQFNSLLDYSKFQKIQLELIEKMKNELLFGITQPDPKKLMTMHIEKVPIIKQE